ncbi:MAG TPA: dihydroorotase, partial [Microbacterium sp.]|nr:dihydroorotase [Microbacterium sp.]
ALRVVHQAMVQTGLLDWADVARVMSRTPAEIGRLDGHGRPIAAGEPAELVFYDADAGGVFSTADLRGRGINSPYLGRELPGSVRYTVHAGRLTVDDGVVTA